MTENKRVISSVLIKNFRDRFASDSSAKVAQNAVTSNTIKSVTLNRQIVQQTDSAVFSHQVDSGWKATNQKSSGRCWLFATLNLLKINAMKKLNVKDFEFSQAHIHFWDKFERANHFLEAIIETASRDVDDRTVAYLLGDPIGDGGQWCMAVNLIQRHGLMPKSAFPESQSSSETRFMNMILKDILRTAACELRALIASGSSTEESVRVMKEARMGDVWRFLCIHLGTPPERFTWSWKDKNGKYHRWLNGEEGTPLDFWRDFASTVAPAPLVSISAPEEGNCESATSPSIEPSSLDDYVCLVHDPRNPYLCTYTVDYLQSVAGAPPVKYLNVDIDTMKDITRRQLQAGLAVWMGCDTGKQMHRAGGMWDKNMFEYEPLYGFSFGMDKTNRLLYGQTLMTHAMMFTGVDVSAEDDAKVLRWRVENSWGETAGDKGFYTMNDNWFNEHMFEIAAPRSFLTAEMLQCFDASEMVTLPAWDPMGSLAVSEMCAVDEDA